jgi:acyl-CoA thioester hydrolase
MLTHKTTCRVIYGDTDKMGYAYHANYFRWFEMGRNEMFRALGLSYKDIETKGFFMPVSEVHCKFMAPVKYDDLLVIETSVDTSIKGGMKFDYRILNNEDDKIVVKGYTLHACVKINGSIVRPPKFIVELIEKNST